MIGKKTISNIFYYLSICMLYVGVISITLSIVFDFIKLSKVEYIVVDKAQKEDIAHTTNSYIVLKNKNDLSKEEVPKNSNIHSDSTILPMILTTIILGILFFIIYMITVE